MDQPSRKIIHIDMDAFYASVEQRDNPELRGKPVAVGGGRERGVVAAASYEARTFGVHSAMPSVTARRKCPDLVFVKPRFEVYKAVSQQVLDIFADFTALIEPLSLDEAYLDVTAEAEGRLAADIASEIRARIFAETGLTASAGVSYNKFLAKTASGHRKPNGQTVIAPSQGAAFVERLAIEKFYGVGPATARRMNALGISTGRDLRQCEPAFLQTHFGKFGQFLYNIARGIDERPVRVNRVRKSVGAENTFFTDITTVDEAREKMVPLIEKVMRVCSTRSMFGRTVTLKVKYNDFEQITRRLTAPSPVMDGGQLSLHVERLLAQVFPCLRPIRLLGVSLSNFENQDHQPVSQMDLAL